jgi:hypothetical protein
MSDGSRVYVGLGSRRLRLRFLGVVVPGQRLPTHQGQSQRGSNPANGSQALQGGYCRCRTNECVGLGIRNREKLLDTRRSCRSNSLIRAASILTELVRLTQFRLHHIRTPGTRFAMFLVVISYGGSLRNWWYNPDSSSRTRFQSQESKLEQ